MARERINADTDVDEMSNLARVSQKLMAAATLIRAMPEPSTPEGRNLHREAQTFIEQVAVQQGESSVSRMRHQATSKDVGGRWDQEASVHTPQQAPTVHEGN
jgi:hypothetical protein